RIQPRDHPTGRAIHPECPATCGLAMFLTPSPGQDPAPGARVTATRCAIVLPPSEGLAPSGRIRLALPASLPSTRSPADQSFPTASRRASGCFHDENDAPPLLVLALGFRRTRPGVDQGRGFEAVASLLDRPRDSGRAPRGGAAGAGWAGTGLRRYLASQ